MKGSNGLVVAAYGRQYEVLMDSGEHRLCFPRGKRSIFAVGDRVTAQPTATGQGVLVGCATRHSLLYRSDGRREKLIAANATQVVAVVAAEPPFSPELLSRCLLATETQQMRAVIVLNKIDLTDKAAAARRALAPFVGAGYPVVELTARGDATPLLPWLAGQVSVLVGQSGMGKSTLVNALVPDAAAATGEISLALSAGRHTTTYARLYRLDAESALIDSPGMQEFGLAHMHREEVAEAFPEFRPLLGNCRFRDCRHDAEPDCAIRGAVEAGQISRLRYGHYRALCVTS
ncbi:MAG: ribosome small subunit-dependent GTPase A [Betaproteobacteria bacterium]|nr:ribosome small subunit-dependent GTPase A [Betaproteobacteria bacterium]